MKYLLTLFAFLFIQNCFAQNELINRQPFTLKMPVDGVNYYEQKIESTPYFVKENVLQIYPGEKLLVEAEIKKDKIISMKVVKENLRPEITIEIDFSQKAKGKKHEMMMLKVANPFKKTLSYKAMMYIAGQKNWLATSIMPVAPELLGYETWPDVIITLVLDQWELK